MTLKKALAIRKFAKRLKKERPARVFPFSRPKKERITVRKVRRIIGVKPLRKFGSRRRRA